MCWFYCVRGIQCCTWGGKREERRYPQNKALLLRLQNTFSATPTPPNQAFSEPDPTQHHQDKLFCALISAPTSQATHRMD